MSTLVLETIMTGLPIGERVRANHLIANAAMEDRTASTSHPSSRTSGESLSDAQQGQLENLQKLIRELLFKNQQLREALMEARSEAESSGAHNGLT
jgi:hypothetical protein